MKSLLTSFSINVGNSTALNILLIGDLQGIPTVGIRDGGDLYPKELTEPDNAVWSVMVQVTDKL